MRLFIALFIAALGFANPGELAAESPEQTDQTEKPEAPAADPKVVVVLDSDDPLVLRGALATLVESDPATIPNRASSRLAEIALEGTDTKARGLALRLLGQMGDRVTGRQKLWPRLADLLDQRKRAPPGRIRGWAAWALGETGAPVDEYGIAMLGAMAPYDGFSRVAALESFVSLSGDVPGYLRRALAASQPGTIRADIIRLLGRVPIESGGMTADEARSMLPGAHRTERDELITIALNRMGETPEELAWLEELLNDESSYLQLTKILERLRQLGPSGSYAAPSVCRLIGRDGVPQHSLYAYFAAVGPAPEAMCAIPRLANRSGAGGDALLAMGGAGLAVFVKWLGDDDTRVEALTALAKAESPPWPAFHAVLTASTADDKYTRAAAARTLSVFEELGQFHLRRMLDDPDPWVRENALNNLEGPGAQKALVGLVEKGSDRVGPAAARRLVEVEGPLDSEAIFEVIMSSEIELSVKLDLARELDRPLFPLFQTLANSEEVDDRLAATLVAVRLADSPHVEAVATKLALLVDDPANHVRREAIRSLESLGVASAGVIESLRSALLDPSRAIRTGAVRALGAIGPDAVAALPDLREMRDSRWNRESAIIEAIIEIEGMDDEFIPIFTDSLSSDAASIERTNAAEMLQHANGSEAARDALREALTDDDEFVRRAAAKSLQKIGDTADQQRARAVLDELGPFIRMRAFPSY